MTDETRSIPHLLTPAEVAAAFHLEPQTVITWAAAGRLPSTCTIGGHRRSDAAQNEAPTPRHPRRHPCAPTKPTIREPTSPSPATRREAEEEADRLRDEKKNGK